MRYLFYWKSWLKEFKFKNKKSYKILYEYNLIMEIMMSIKIKLIIYMFIFKRLLNFNYILYEYDY